VDLDDGPYKERLIGLHASLFDERIKYWKVHDCSRHFSNFYEEITQKDIASSLPIIIMHKEEVCGVILKHLQIKGSMSVLSLVDLLSVLSKDLRNEFYPNLFYQAMQVLVDLLDPRYPELLEAIFVCISYLFKFLMKYLVKDIQDIFR
jgi:U3 small nucleolar RNA-associated protein 20